MDKRLLIAAGVSLLILISWTTLFPPPKRPQVPAPSELARSVEDIGTEVEAPAVPPDEALPAEAGVAAEAVAASAAEQVHVETTVFDVLLTNEGASALAWKLREYKTEDGKPLDLLPTYVTSENDPGGVPKQLGVSLDEPSIALALDEALWQVEREELAPEGDLGAGQRVTFRWADGAGLVARKAFVFRDLSYVVGVELEVTDRGRRLPAGLRLGPGFGAQEAASSYYYEAWVRSVNGQATHTQRRKNKGYADGAGTMAGNLEWVGLEDQYFAGLLLLPGGPARLTTTPIELVREPLPGQETAALAEMMVAATVPEQGAQLFVGPKRRDLLAGVDPGLERCIWYFDVKLLAWISNKIHSGLLWLHHSVVPNYGLAIVLATIILRVLLFPVNQYAMVNMKKTQLQMQRLQPKIKRIREKFKKNRDSESRAAMNQEMMDLYRKEGVNPMGGVTGCLPMIAQFPILIGFYGMLTVAVELRGAEFFGWIHDLSRHDPFFVLPLLMGVTMFGQQAMAMTKVKDPVQQQQQRIMMIMPVVFTVICLYLPSGLVLYWFINNLLGMGQQALVNRHTVRLEAAHSAAEARSGRKGKDDGEEEDEEEDEPVAASDAGQRKRQGGERKAKAKLTR